ncbi:Pentatricopeptide repeat-containing protein [Vitis vinifera]|uniref:Pentatricopeptide repeat-containing protein n=1 Tax=Vitis vinifera TaxID=29760 RepID=A0A438KD77_VITVI|nr:Pentatricopeptide repeat-containing protein [Vitis vinifera]
MQNEGVIPGKFTFPCAIKACLDALEIKKIHGLLFKFGLELDVFIGSALVNCYLKFGLMEHTQVAFEELPIRDVVIWDDMVNGYAQIGQFEMCIEDALEIFEMMRGKDIFSWNSIVSVHEECGDHDGTLRLLDRMVGARIQLDLVTITIILQFALI